VLSPVLSELTLLASGLAGIALLIAVHFARLSSSAILITSAALLLRLWHALARGYLSAQLPRVLLLHTLAGGFAFFVHFRFAF